LEATFAPDAKDEVVDQREGDVIQHQCRNNFVHSEFGLENPGNEPPGSTKNRSPHSHGEQRHKPRGVFGDHAGQDYDACPQSPHKELALGPYIPDLHLEGHRAGGTSEDEWGCLYKRVREDPQAAKGSACNVRVGSERVTSDDRQNNCPYYERENYGNERNKRRQPTRRIHARLNLQFERPAEGLALTRGGAHAAGSSA
jgi:hypothetical protein